VHLPAAFLLAEKIGKFFCINRLKNEKSVSSMTQNTNFKTKSSETQNHDIFK
jgi:hypothetical protein